MSVALFVSVKAARGAVSCASIVISQCVVSAFLRPGGDGTGYILYLSFMSSCVAAHTPIKTSTC